MENGSESDDPIDISDQFRRHWGDIFGDERYSGDDPVVNHAAMTKLLDTITKTLSPPAAAELDAPLTAVELAATIRHLRRSSAPGLDGLGPALYQLDPDAFGAVFVVVFKHQLGRGQLLASQRKSSVSLPYKKGDRRHPGNYRPISLMQVDVKILSKALAFRLQRYHPLLVHPEQKGFVRGRSLHHHVRMLHDIQELLQRRGQKGYALFLDFAKAYDRVNWDYLFRVLEKFGCGPAFCSWVKLLYSQTEATLSLNGTLQEVLRPIRGVKQGDPLSSLLFVLTIEPLGNLLRTLPEVGIPVTPSYVSTGLYFADDSTLLSTSINGLQRQVDLVELYCAGSGAKLNLDKSELVSFAGDSITANATPFGVGSSPSVVYLGVPVGPAVNLGEVCSSLETKVCTRLARWGGRARTYRGRLLILNAMVLSVLWHFTPHFSLPAATVHRLQRLCERYLLTRRSDSGRHFVKLAKPSICYVSFNRGGLQIPDLEATGSTQRTMILQQLFLMPSDEPWKACSSALLHDILP